MISIEQIKPDFVYRNNEVVATILDINVFNNILERIRHRSSVYN
mgnify:CR=1 FL=1